MLTGKGKIWVLVGTRPEVIKQAPLFWALQKQYGKDRVELVSTGQHRELLDQALKHFSLLPSRDFHLMQSQSTLSDLGARILERMGKEFVAERPDWIVVQGDTISAAMAAWAAFLAGVKVLHNEAGLRSFDLHHPFPEEANRKIISAFADFNAAPTNDSAEQLKKEGAKNIFVSGNTGIDALLWTLTKTQPQTSFTGENYVLLTAHRRENAEEFKSYFSVLAKFVRANKNLNFIFPVHPNNLARQAAEKYLHEFSNVNIISPLDYGSTCHLLSRCAFVVTDSGGLQEEASSLGIPVVVMRKTTERAEAVRAGWAKLCDPGEESKFADALSWAKGKSQFGIKNNIQNPIFGSGDAADKIVQALVSTYQ